MPAGAAPKPVSDVDVAPEGVVDDPVAGESSAGELGVGGLEQAFGLAAAAGEVACFVERVRDRRHRVADPGQNGWG